MSSSPAGAQPLRWAASFQGVRPRAFRFLEGDVDAEHPACAGAQFVQAHRCVLDRGGEFEGAEQRPAGFELGEDDAAAVEPVVAERDPAESGDVEAAVGAAESVGDVHVCEPAHQVGGGAGEVDAHGLAHQAAAAVGAHQIPGGDAVLALRRRYRQLNGFRLPAQAGEFVSPAQVHPEVARPLLQQPHHSRLLDGQRVHRVVGHVREVQRHGGEDPPVDGSWRVGVSGEHLIQAAHVEHPNHLPDKAVGLGLGAGSGQCVQHDGPDAGQRQLAGEHQPVGPGAGDDDAGVFVSHAVAPCVCWVRAGPRRRRRSRRGPTP